MAKKMFYAHHPDYYSLGVGDSAKAAIESLERQCGFSVHDEGVEALVVVEGVRKKLISQPAYIVAGDYDD